MTKSHNCYDLSKSGLEHWLGPLEARVMDALWSSDRRPLPLQRVWRELGAYDWAMTTIQTTLNRLVAKGLVGRNSDQPVYRYFAVLPRAAWERRNVEALLSSLAEEYGDVVEGWLEQRAQIRGRPVSEETRKKISRSKKGHPIDPEHHAKLLAAHTGKPLSEEHKQKIAAAHRGRTYSEETHQRMSQAQRGRRIGPMSEEHKQKIAAAHRGKKGTPWTEEHRRKVLETKRRKRENIE